MGWLLPHWRTAAFALAAAACTWAGWHARSVVAEAEQGRLLREQMEARMLAEKRTADIGQQAEADLAALRASNRQLTRELTRETTDPAYRCPVPADGVRLFNRAAAGARPGRPDRPVPAARRTAPRR